MTGSNPSSSLMNGGSQKKNNISILYDKNGKGINNVIVNSLLPSISNDSLGAIKQLNSGGETSNNTIVPL